MFNIAEVYPEGSLIISNRNWIGLTLEKGILLKGHCRHTKLMGGCTPNLEMGKRSKSSLEIQRQQQ